MTLDDERPIWMRLIWTPNSRIGRLSYAAFAVLIFGFLIYRGIASEAQLKKNQRLWATVESLTSERIADLDLYSLYVVDSKEKYRFLKRISQEAGVNGFLSNLRDLSRWTPNHPLDTDEYVVVARLTNGNEIRMKMARPMNGEPIYHIYVCSNDDAHLTLKSKDLLRWTSGTNHD